MVMTYRSESSSSSIPPIPGGGERVSSRTYLSIGDVLTLLREELPDVTISQIRFLESQGLVNPERSPFGYRKFFEHDVERLRWVLRQQREHFLPPRSSGTGWPTGTSTTPGPTPRTASRRMQVKGRVRGPGSGPGAAHEGGRGGDGPCPLGIWNHHQCLF